MKKKQESDMRDVSVLIKPASGNCNMRCRYCFYADESGKRGTEQYGMMSLETAEYIVSRFLAHAEHSCTFAFQGGEPTLRGLDFLREFVQLTEKYNARKLQIQFALQTNGLLIDGEWASFLKDNGFLVGLSLDGGSKSHDLNRIDAQGRGTFNRVMKTVVLLKKHNVPFNILTVVNAGVARHINSIYDLYKKNGLLYQQYIPCLDPIFEERGQRPYSLTPELFGDFLIALFDKWFADRSSGRFIYIHYFESLAGMLLGCAPASCGMLGVCSAQYVIEADGSVYPCDFYVLDDYAIGSIRDDEIAVIDQRRVPFLQQSLQGLEQCRVCQYGNICCGGCRRDRQGREGLGENYFCESYRRFFDYALPKLAGMLATDWKWGNRLCGSHLFW